MKRLMVVFFVMLFFPLVIALCPPDCQDDEELIASLMDNPSLSKNLGNEDLARVIVQEPLLLEREFIFNDIDGRAKLDISFLNDNEVVKRKWFDGFGIIDEGVQIESYDGNEIKTNGEKGVTMVIRSHKPRWHEGEIYSPLEDLNLKLNEDGSLTFSDKTTVSSATIPFDKSLYARQIEIIGGQVEIAESSSYEDIEPFNLKDSLLKYGDLKISSDESIKLSFFDSLPLVQGKEILLNELNGEQEVLKYSFSGNEDGVGGIMLIGEDHFLVNRNTNLIRYHDDKPVLSFMDGRQTVEYIENINPEDFNSIGNLIILNNKEDGAKLYVKTNEDPIQGENKLVLNIPRNQIETLGEDGNKILEETTDYIKHININTIEDDSEVILNYHEEVGIKLSKDPFEIINGDPTKMGIYLDNGIMQGNKPYFQGLGNILERDESSFGVSYGSDTRTVSNEALVAKQLIEGIVDKKQVIAVLVSIDKYNEGGFFEDLPSARIDTENIKDSLVKNGIPDKNVVLLSSPTKQEFFDSLDEVNKKYPSSQKLLIWSGHGTIESDTNLFEENYYVNPADSSYKEHGSGIELIGVTNGININEIESRLSSGDIALLNTCHSGGMLINRDKSKDIKYITTSGPYEKTMIQIDSEKKQIGSYFFNFMLEKENIPSIDRNLQNGYWRTNLEVIKRIGSSQTPSVVGFVISLDESGVTMIIVNKENFGQPIRAPIVIRQYEV